MPTGTEVLPLTALEKPADEEPFPEVCELEAEVLETDMPLAFPEATDCNPSLVVLLLGLVEVVDELDG